MTTIVNPLPIPKPKRFAPREKNPFFPLTFSCAASASTSTSAGAPAVWNHFTGYLVGRWVAIFHRGDAETLARANFGKGALSKFGLFFDVRDRKLVPIVDHGSIETEQGEQEEEERESGEHEEQDEWTDEPPANGPPPAVLKHHREAKFEMSKRRYDRHVLWRREVLGQCGVDTSDVETGADANAVAPRLDDDAVADVVEEDDDDDVVDEEPVGKRARLGETTTTTTTKKTSKTTVTNDPQGTTSPSQMEEQQYFSGDFLICEDGASEDEEEDGADDGFGRRRKRLLFSRDEDPLPLKECLLLSHEEAFFLSYGLGCLTVMSSSPLGPIHSPTDVSSPSSCAPNASPSSSLSSAPLPLLQLWRRFLAFDARFLSRYVAYHFYRSRGWVPRCGLKFGVDFLLYVTGPRAYHATFSVLVERVDEELRRIGPLREASSSPTAAAGLSRVTEQVNKDLLLCYVVEPHDRDSTRVCDSPDCVRQFRVKEVLKKRWITDTERDQTKGLLLSMT